MIYCTFLRSLTRNTITDLGSNKFKFNLLELNLILNDVENTSKDDFIPILNFNLLW